MHTQTPKRMVPGLSERLASLRRASGLSQQVLATRAGISIPRLRDAERFGAATTETLNLLARALGTDVDVLSGRRPGATTERLNPPSAASTIEEMASAISSSLPGVDAKLSPDGFLDVMMMMDDRPS